MPRTALAFGGAVALALTVAGPAAAQTKPTASPEQFSSTLAVAQGAVPGGQMLRARVEQNGKVFGFYFWNKGKVVEIEISPDGTIVKNVTTDPVPNPNPSPKDVSPDVVRMVTQQRDAKAKLPEGRLLEIASGNLKDGKVNEIKYAKVGDKLVLQVGDAFFDAATGKPVAK